MLSLHTNVAGLAARNAVGRTQDALSNAMTRLSTGYRINSAMDDAAGLQIASRLKAQASGMAVAMRNTQNSTSLLQTAEGALSELDNILVRMKDLAIQAADASSTANDKSAMQAEYGALNTEIGNILDNTTFAGKAMLRNGTLASSMSFQIGATASETVSVDLSASLNSMMGHIGNASASALTATPNASVDLLATAINAVGSLRSSLGAVANRLGHVHDNLANMSTHTRAAAGRIMDADFAQESAIMTTSQMLMQAGTAMLKQSSSMSSMVMTLLG